MELIIVKDNIELGNIVSDIFEEVIRTKNNEGSDAVLGLATGSTPLPVYEELVRRYSNGKIDFENTTTFNLDEYININYLNESSYHKYMDDYLFKHININPNKTYIPDGNSKNLDKEILEYEKKIKNVGGIDLQILGVGENGHIGFNEPSSNLNLYTNVVDLPESTIHANSRFFDDISKVPRQAITMGVGTILNAKKIILMATGKKKTETIKSLLYNEGVSTMNPVSLLKLHKDFTLIIDEELYNEIQK